MSVSSSSETLPDRSHASSGDAYLEHAKSFYDALAETPELGACCVQRNDLELPGLVVPEGMSALSFSCGTTVHPDALTDAPTVLYIGVGGGLEALQFAWFSRRPGGVIAIEPSPRMRDAATRNLAEAAKVNDWFETSFVQILAGDAFALPVPDESVDLVAQNCLFNIFEPSDLQKALREAARVLRQGGRLMMSDPVATRDIPAHLKQDDRLRALCLSGALTFEEYTQQMADAGFGRIDVRSRKPYRTLDATTYRLDTDLPLYALDTVSFKTGADGSSGKAHVHTGRRAVYTGPQDALHLPNGSSLVRHRPSPVSDLQAEWLRHHHAANVLLTPPTWRSVGTST